MIKKILNQQKGTLKVIFKKPISDQISKLDRLTHFNGRLLDQYNSLIGFADLEKLHEKIGHIQDQLLITQNKRQSILIELLSTRKELNSLQSEIQNSKRGTDNKYLQLVQQEYDILNKESELNDHFNLADQEERNYFSQLQSRINILHDKSRSHTRQWSIISTIVGALLGVFGTTINFYFRNNEYRKINFSLENKSDELLLKIQDIQSGLTDMKTNVTKIKESVDSSKNNESWYGFFKRKSIATYKYCTRN